MTRPYVLRSRKPKALARNVAAIRGYILENEGATMDKIAGIINRTESVAHTALAELRKEKWVFTQMNSRVARYYSMEYALKHNLPKKISKTYKRDKRAGPVARKSNTLNDRLTLSELWPARSKVYSG